MVEKFNNFVIYQTLVCQCILANTAIEEEMRNKLSETYIYCVYVGLAFNISIAIKSIYENVCDIWQKKVKR